MSIYDFFISIAYAANIGGTGVVTGTYIFKIIDQVIVNYKYIICQQKLNSM